MSVELNTVLLNNILEKFGFQVCEVWKSGNEGKYFDGWRVARKNTNLFAKLWFGASQNYAKITANLETLTVFETPKRFSEAVKKLQAELKKKGKILVSHHVHGGSPLR
jgi:hypothetical protein